MTLHLCMFNNHAVLCVPPITYLLCFDKSVKFTDTMFSSAASSATLKTQSVCRLFWEGDGKNITMA